MPLRLSASLAALASALVLAAPAAADEGWTQQGALPDAPPDHQIVYPAPSWYLPLAAPVGDVNGDGTDDFVFSSGPDASWVTFSRRGAAPVTAGHNGAGFAIDSPASWYGVKGIGDVNRDGLDDVAIVTWQATYVVFGKTDDDPVDLDNLGDSGFTITGVTVSGGGGSLVMTNDRIAALGDVNGDDVPDFVVGSGTVIYPSGNDAGKTIDGSRPGPRISFLRSGLRWTMVDNLGVIDGHHAVMVAGDRPDDNSDYAAYGAIVPGPGKSVDLGDAVADDRAFLLTADKPDGVDWWGLESASTLGDENGDGRREVGLVGIDGTRELRVVFSPSFGTTESVSDLGATDSRGYKFHTYFNDIDVGDQNGDGRGDFSTDQYVYFTNPGLETGNRQPVYSGYYLPNDDVIGAVADLDGDGRSEIAGAHRDQDGAFYIDVYDSGAAPSIGPVSVTQADWWVTPSFNVVTGARLGHKVEISKEVEFRADGETWPVPADANYVTADPWQHFEPSIFTVDKNGDHLVRGKTYELRVTIRNGRGTAASDWVPFTYNGPDPYDPGPEPPIGQYLPTDDSWHPWSAGGTTPPPLAPPPAYPIVLPPPTPLPARNRTSKPAQAKVIRGTAKADNVSARDIAERIFGLGGNDRINARGGDDFIDGGSGNDTLMGGTGNDSLVGGGGIDKLLGGSGNDWINSNDHRAETIDCGPGKDTVVADKKDKVRHCETVRRQR